MKKYNHDCEFCRPLGNFQGHDLYYCNVHHPTVIARFGNEPEDYTSGLRFAELQLVPELTEALDRARRQGLHYNEGC